MEIDYNNGIKLKFSITNDRPDIFLFIDGLEVMTTEEKEHKSMKKAIEECPENARVFIGGLGFGLILKYLEQSKKAKEIIVCEIDQRIIDLFEVDIRKVCPNFVLIKGDAHEEITKNGLFDWVYMDLSVMPDDVLKHISINYLNKNGIYTEFVEWLQ